MYTGRENSWWVGWLKATWRILFSVKLTFQIKLWSSWIRFEAYLIREIEWEAQVIVGNEEGTAKWATRKLSVPGPISIQAKIAFITLDVLCLVVERIHARRFRNMVVLSFGGEMLKVSASAEVTRELNASDPDAPVSGDEIIDVGKEVDGFEGQESFSSKREGGDRSMASEKEAQNLALYRRESW